MSNETEQPEKAEETKAATYWIVGVIMAVIMFVGSLGEGGGNRATGSYQDWSITYAKQWT